MSSKMNQVQQYDDQQYEDEYDEEYDEQYDQQYDPQYQQVQQQQQQVQQPQQQVQQPQQPQQVQQQSVSPLPQQPKMTQDELDRAAVRAYAATPRAPGYRPGAIRESRIKDRPASRNLKDDSLSIKIELDLEVEVDLYARVKGGSCFIPSINMEEGNWRDCVDITIGLLWGTATSVR